jgi:hypothetical protein
MAVRVYIANANGTSKVYLENASCSLSQPSPEIPDISYEVFGGSSRTIPGWSGSTITVGKTLRFVAGSDESSGSISITVPLLTAAECVSIRTKASNPATVLYSPDNGSSVWECTFTPGENPEFSSIEGFPGYYSGKIELDIVRKL